MNRTLFRVVHSHPDPDLRLNALPDPGKGRGRSAVFLGSALLAGMLAALVYLARPDLGALELLDETPTTEAQVAEAATLTPTVPVTTLTPDLAGTLPAGQVPAAPTGGVLPFATPPVFPRPVDFSSVDLRTVVAPATATPTRTPLPPLANTDAVAGAGGAVLWNLSGLEVTRVPQGALLMLRARARDGAWLYAETADGKTGWVAADEVITSDADRLAVEEVVIIPITPTPAEAAAAGTSAPAVVSAPGTAALTARVTVTDARLNIRSGPGPDYPVVDKADPGALLPLLGRGPAGWVQVRAAGALDGVGWVAVEYVETSVPVDTLPVVTGQPVTPSGPEVGATTKGGVAAASTGARVLVPPGEEVLLVPTVTPPRPSTGLQGKLVIQRSWGAEIYLYDLATGELRLLTGGFDPAFSPGGKTVAFTRAGGEHGLYLIDVDGQNERLIFSGREQLRSPKFSPDGRYIVFERGDQVIVCRESREGCLPNTPGNDSLPRATEPQTKLARVDINGQNYRDIPVLDRAHAPDWNTAGIVYQSPGGLQITQDAPGATSELVFFNIQKQYEHDPDWQPGGGRIVFQRREPGGGVWRILSINPDGSDLRDLTRPTFTLVDQLPTHVAPAWSPDGRHIVFLSDRMPDPTGQGYTAGRWHVWVMDADGGNARQLPVELEFNYTFVSEQMLDWGP
jgi:Tol biopolymer transport system component/uncharacterized protein YraI